jgi:hypothetical protein
MIAAALAACGDPPIAPDGPAGAWLFGRPLPEPRLEPGVAALGNRVAVVGGFDAQLAIVATGFLIDPNAPVGQHVLPLPPAPVAWTHLGLAGRAGSLYLLGGLEGSGLVPRGEAFVLDTAQPAWMPLPPLPIARGAAGIAVGPTQIFVAGGATATAATASVLAFDVGSATWTELPDLPAPRSHPAAFALADGSLIVAGGLATLASTSARQEVWRLDTGAPTWRALAPLPTARGGCAYGTVGAHLICAGGESGGGALAVVEAYDVASDTWTARAAMPDPRAGTQGAAFGARLYVPGGARQLAFEPLDTLLVFAP